MSVAILKIRRGTIVPSLFISEPFFDETLETLHIGTNISGSDTEYITLLKLNDTNVGSLILTADISASNLNLSGDIDIDGNANIGGTLIVGGSEVGSGSLGAVLSGSLIPSAGDTFTIGSPAKRWTTLYVNDLNVTNGITASFVEYSNIANLPTLVSGSSQIDHNTTANYIANQHINHAGVNINTGDGLLGGGNITISRTLTLDTGSAHFISGVLENASPLPSGVVSSSSQISYTGLSNIPSGIVSGSSQLTSSYDTRYVLNSGDTIDGNLVVTGNIVTSGSISVVGGTSSQYLLADGTVAEPYLSTTQSVDMPIPKTEVISTVPTGSHRGAFFDYTVYSGSHARAGTVMSIHTNNNFAFTDNSTVDIGDTSDLTFSVDVVDGNFRLRATSTTTAWEIRTITRKL